MLMRPVVAASSPIIITFVLGSSLSLTPKIRLLSISIYKGIVDGISAAFSSVRSSKNESSKKLSEVSGITCIALAQTMTVKESMFLPCFSLNQRSALCIF